jgi:hypothetical protein
VAYFGQYQAKRALLRHAAGHWECSGYRRGKSEVIGDAQNRALEPTATLAVHCGNGFAGFSPYQSACLSR